MRVWFNRSFSSIHSALGLIRAGDRERRYTLLCSGAAAHPAVIEAADVYFDEPTRLDVHSYVEWCLETCSSQCIDIFVPGKRAVAIAAAEPRFHAKGTRVLSAAAPDTLSLLHNKGLFYKTVRSASASAPKCIECTSLAEFDAAYATLSEADSQPVCIKPAESVYGIGFRRIRTDSSAYDIMLSADQYQIDLSSLRALLSRQGRFAPLLVMEYLAGPEYSVDCIGQHGKIECAIAREKPQGGRHSQRIVSRQDIQQACRDIAAQFTLNGYLNMQFREGRDGLCVLEVNPRMSGGIAMASLSGTNLPYYGLAGFDLGYRNLDLPPTRSGVLVAERNHAFEVSQ